MKHTYFTYSHSFDAAISQDWSPITYVPCKKSSDGNVNEEIDY